MTLLPDPAEAAPPSPPEGENPTPKMAETPADKPGEKPAEEKKKDAPKGNYPLLIGTRVLAVDDSLPIRKLVVHVFSSLGRAAVDQAEDGAKALVKLRKALETGSPFRLMMMDLHMPQMDGYSLLKAVREDEQLKSLPVIVVTTEGQRESVLRCAKLGVQGYLLKPFKTHYVLDVATTALQNAAKGAVAEPPGDIGPASKEAP